MQAQTQAPVLNAFVDDGGREIVLIEQLAEGIRERRVPAEYTTYHRTSSLRPETIRVLKRSENVTHIVKETETWTRIGWRDMQVRRQAVWKFRDIGVETYEGDVDPVRYWFTETKAPIARPRRCYLDIEGDSRVPFSRKEDMRILVWALSDDTGPIAKGVLFEDSDDAETELLKRLWSYLDNYDQVIAWYGGDPDDRDSGFDFFVIASRSRKRGLPIDTRRWLWLDQLVVWRRMNQAESGDEKESMRLEDIAQNQVGEGKEKTPDWVVERFGDKTLAALAWDLWLAGGKFRKLLVDYCVKDTELLRKLEARKGFITLFQSVCEATAVIGNTRGLLPTGQMDGFLLRLGREQDYRFGTKRYSDKEEEDAFKGAFVLAPRTVFSKPDKRGEGGWTKKEAAEWRRIRGMKDGILRNVHVCDFASLYPSNIITWNLSEEVAVEDDEVIEAAYEAYTRGEPLPEGICRSPGTGFCTYTNKIGILPLALEELLRLRKKYADESAKYPPGTPRYVDAMAKSTAYKVIANSFYGVTGARTSRYFNRSVAESTTQNGVWLIKSVMKEGDKRKIESIAGDTDSAFVIGPTREGFDAFVNWLNKNHIPKIVAATGAKKSAIKLAFEKSFDILVFATKKRYIGRYNHYKWKTTCNHCKDKKGNPGSVDVRTLVCADCKFQYKDQPIFIGKPEIKGIEYRRGDGSRLGREMQGQIIDLLVGGLKTNPDMKDVERPVMDMDVYVKLIDRWRNRILAEPLSREDVRISKSIKELSEYASTTKKGEKPKTPPIHVTIAKALQERGQSITPGTKIEYVVVDSSVSPQKAIPAEDFNGDCDRYYLWDTMVYPPSQRLLEGAFPEFDWAKFADVRPAKPKKSSKVHEDQLGLSFAPKKVSPRGDTYDELAVPTFSKQPLSIRVPESVGKKGLIKIHKILEAHPGARTVELTIVLNTGAEAILKSSMRVMTGPKLKAEVEQAIQTLTS